MNVEICLHDLEVTSKDMANRLVGKITNELAHYPCSIPFRSFMDAMGNGRTWSGAIFEPQIKKAKYWARQQVFAIDVDNNGDEKIGIGELAQHYTHQGMPPNGWYESLSSTAEQVKFRMIWMTEEPVTDPIIAKNFNRWLIMNSKGFADSCTINLDRLFFGGKAPYLCCDQPIPNELIPQKEEKQRKNSYSNTRFRDFIEDPTRYRIAKRYVKRAIADPTGHRWITRYKTIFNGAVYLITASNGTLSVDEVYDYMMGCIDKNPDAWENYHHSHDEMYDWVCRAYDWAVREILV